MARVTVEDCIVKVPNRFNLVMLAAQRARNVSAGAELTVDRDNDKNPVVALREIAEETVDLGELETNLVSGLQRFVEMDEPEEDELDMESLAQAVNGDAPSEDTEPAPAEEVAEDVLTVHDEAEEAVPVAEEGGED